MRNTVFYSKSKKDENSPRFLSIMGKMPFAKDFIYFCVDPDPVSKKRNEDLLTVLGITDVPTMYVDGQKYVGEDAFQYLRMAVHQMQGGSGAGGGSNYPGGNAGAFDEPYPQMSPGGMQDMYHMQQQPQPQPGLSMPQMPGMGQMPQMPGFAAMGNRMQPPQMGMQMQGGPQLQGIDTAGSGGPRGGLNGGSGGGGDNAYADPFAPTDITGINSCNLSPEQILTPIQTKNSDGSSRMDDMLKEYAMQRDSMMPGGPPSGTMPGMNVSMQQMAMPQMQMRR